MMMLMSRDIILYMLHTRVATMWIVGPVKVHFGSHTILSFVGAGGYSASVSPYNLQFRGRWRVQCLCESI